MNCVHADSGLIRFPPMPDSTSRGDFSDNTRQSLLWDLRDSSQRTRFEQAWEEFHQIYSEPMYGWCRQKGLKHDDAQDLVQDLMVRLVRELKRFTYDSRASFRGWLKTVTNRAVIDLFRSQRRFILKDGAELECLSTDSVEQEIMRAFDQELLKAARTKVKGELDSTAVGKRNWEIYIRVAENEEPVAKVAETYGISHQLVYVAKHRVVQRLSEVVNEIGGA